MALVADSSNPAVKRDCANKPSRSPLLLRWRAASRRTIESQLIELRETAASGGHHFVRAVTAVAATLPLVHLRPSDSVSRRECRSTATRYASLSTDEH